MYSYKHVVCHRCGHDIEICTDMQLASNPPLYEFICTDCGYREYIRCDEFKYLYNKYGKDLLLKTRG